MVRRRSSLRRGNLRLLRLALIDDGPGVEEAEPFVPEIAPDILEGSENHTTLDLKAFSHP